ncbi:MAG: hypothetical protein IJ649_03535 [Oscillospiraceae bacterium]|nr:hypothetical protein [Oscillospiraceae bacterium]
MSSIIINTAARRQRAAEIIPDLPAVGTTFNGRRVRAVVPFPLHVTQERPGVYAYAIWRVYLGISPFPHYVAVQEPEAEAF